MILYVWRVIKFFAHEYIVDNGKECNAMDSVFHPPKNYQYFGKWRWTAEYQT
jgi:hypothetical protein